MTKLNAWLSRLLQEQGQYLQDERNIERASSRAKIRFSSSSHGVPRRARSHPWAPNEVRESKIIFIGRRLDKEEIPGISDSASHRIETAFIYLF